MIEIMKKIGELLSVVEQRIVSYGHLVKENDARAAKLDEQDKDIVARTKDLLAREAKIKPIEDVVALKEQAVTLKKQADDLLHSVRKEKQEFTDWKVAEKKKMDEERGQITVDRANANNEIAKAQKEWINLKKEQETWKAKFIEEIKLKVK